MNATFPSLESYPDRHCVQENKKSSLSCSDSYRDHPGSALKIRIVFGVYLCVGFLTFRQFRVLTIINYNIEKNNHSNSCNLFFYIAASTTAINKRSAGSASNSY